MGSCSRGESPDPTLRHDHTKHEATTIIHAFRALVNRIGNIEAHFWYLHKSASSKKGQ